MKYGVKIFPDGLKLVDIYSKYFDFFELYITPDIDFSELEILKGKDVIIHAAHIKHGFRPANPLHKDVNTQLIKLAIKAADILKAKYIVIHPDVRCDGSSEESFIDFIKENFDKRMLFENLPFYESHDNTLEYYFSKPKDMARLLDVFKTGLTLDISHAVCSAIMLDIDSTEILDSFSKLNVLYYHLSGNFKSSKKDNHQHLSDDTFDREWFKFIPPNSYVLFETGNIVIDDISLFLKDLEYVKKHLGN